MIIRKVYVPVLFEETGEHIVDGEEQETLQDAENFAMAMIAEFVEETDKSCYAKIENRLVTDC